MKIKVIKKGATQSKPSSWCPWFVEDVKNTTK
jgi:hypothetical protein